MPTHEHMLATANSYIDGFAQHNVAAIIELFADNATVEDPVGSTQVTGQAAIRNFYEHAMSMRLTLTLEGPVRIVADYAAFPFSIHLTTSNGKRRIDAIDIFRFNKDGKIIEMRAFWGPQNNHQIK